MSELRIDLDWTKLLGFDHCTGAFDAGVSAHAAKVGSKVPGICARPGELTRSLSAKVGAKQMLRRAGEPDTVALTRLTKVGLKNN